MDYNTAVKEKMARQKEAEIDTPVIEIKSEGIVHPFQQSFYTQESFEDRKFLWFRYRKSVGKKVFPRGLCEICDKLEIEHD